jgi:uncharacterized protein (DUF433 family)
MMGIQTPTPVDLSKYIETRLFGERPHLRGRRVPVATVARWQRANSWTVAEVAENFSIPEIEVLAALLYYEQHQTLLDAQEDAENRLFDEMKRHSLHSTN